MGLRTIWSQTTEWVRKRLSTDEFAQVEQPEMGNWRGLIKSYEDAAYKLNPDAYRTMLAQDAIAYPMQKFAERLSGMTLTVVGTGKRRDKLQEIINAASGVGDMLAWFAYAKIEGVRFMSHRATFDEKSEMFIPDFRGCGARKWKAGGTMYWEGWEADQERPEKAIGKLEEQSLGDARDKDSAAPKWFDRKDWTVFRPGAGTSPEGDLDLIKQFYLLAESAQLLDKAMRVYADRYQLPREMLKEMIDKLRPDEYVSRMSAGAAKIKQSNSRQRMTMGAETVIELLEPKGTTWGFLTEYRAILEKRSYRLIFGEDLSLGGGEGGDRGGKELGNKEATSSIVAFGNRIADCLTEDWLPWVEQVNDAILPKLKSSEPRPYLELRPVADKQKMSIAELAQIATIRIPMTKEDVYATIGKDCPPGAPDVFTWENLTPANGEDGGTNPDGSPKQPEGMPSNSGDSTQRKDREQKDSNMPAQRPQKDSNDLRNLKRDSE